MLIGDINVNVSDSYVSSFADDTRIAHAISNDNDQNNLQNDLETIYAWASENNMLFNNEKFECIQYSSNSNSQRKDATHRRYKAASGTVITPTDSVKDLGVFLDNDASFQCHISKTIAKAKNISSWILRTFNTRRRKPMLLLWKTLVLPVLDYCSQLWSPFKKGEIEKIEALQRWFTAKISGMNNMDYWERLHSLGLYSLERHRERYIIIYACTQ